MSVLKQVFKKSNRTNFLLALLSVLMIVIFGIIKKQFVTLDNFINMGHQMAMTAVLAFAGTAVVIAQGTDISVGGNLALSGIVGALAYQAGVPVPLVIVILLITGSFVGVINGCLIRYLKINPFLTTFSMLSVCRGLSLTVTNARGIEITDPALIWLGSAKIGGLPVSIIVMFLLLFIWWIILNRTTFGRYIYAVGGNSQTAMASAISSKTIQFLTFVLSGLSVGVAAVLYIGRVKSAQPLAGNGLEFDVLTAVIIGGTLLSGGKGSVIGTMFGTIMVTIIKTGLSFFGVPQQIIYVFTGALILVAVLTYQENLWGIVKSSIKQSLIRRLKISDSVSQKGHILKIENLCRSYSGFMALSNMNTEIHSGEIVALIGENGAGKSTLVKILCGVTEPSGGRIEIDGVNVTFNSSIDAYESGIGVIHQHYSLVPELTIAENIFLGKEPRKMALLNRQHMRSAAKKMIADFNVDLKPDTRVSYLTTGQKQIVELLKASLGNPWLIIMDEPTSSLSKNEIERLYKLVEQLAAKHVAILFISHKMEEIFRICKRGLVLRDGALMGDVDLANVTQDEVIRLMVGRNIESVFKYQPSDPGDIVVEVDNVCDDVLLHNVSFNVRKGEVVALVGLMGAGRTEILKCLFGLAPYKSGEIRINGQMIRPTPKKMLKQNVAYVPEDRHEAGLVKRLTVRHNLSLIWIKRHNKAGFMNISSEKNMAGGMIGKANIKPPDQDKETQYLSGGNQQKVVLGKWLAVEPDILLLDDPTRGVDVGAKSEIYEIIGQYKVKGAAVVLVSSELVEAMNVADRIIVMYHGETVREFKRGVTEAEIMHYALGVFRHKEALANG